jgi:hypothetical protein
VLDRNQAPAGSGLRLSTDQALANTLVLKREYREARAIYDLYLAVADFALVRARPIPLPDGSTVAIGPTR